MAKRIRHLRTLARLGNDSAARGALNRELERLTSLYEMLTTQPRQKAAVEGPLPFRHPRVLRRGAIREIREQIRAAASQPDNTLLEELRGKIYDLEHLEEVDCSMLNDEIDMVSCLVFQTPEQRMQLLNEHRRVRTAATRGPFWPGRPAFHPYKRRSVNRNTATEPCCCWLCRHAYMFKRNGKLRSKYVEPKTGEPMLDVIVGASK